MSRTTHVWIEEPRVDSGASVAAMTVEGPEHKRTRIWYRVPADYRSCITPSGDPYALAMIFTAMRLPSDLHIHGTVSPSLLRNLEEFQSAWCCWRPERYHMVEIRADAEEERPLSSSPAAALTLFSGGVDSCFTAYSHRRDRCGRRAVDLRAGLMVLGFDFTLQQSNAYDRAAARAQTMLESIGMELIAMVTNIRDLAEPWWDFHGAAPASCLMLLQDGFGTGIIPSTEPYDALVLPWGSNPVTDWMMSSDSFRIVHHGAALSRTDKVNGIARWPEALEHVRVCMIGKENEVDRNCGVCQKCVRTILNFRVLGVGLPASFEQDVTDDHIARLQVDDPLHLAELQRILVFAKRRSLAASWVEALEVCLIRNRLRLAKKRSYMTFLTTLKNVKTVVAYRKKRVSPISRRS